MIPEPATQNDSAKPEDLWRLHRINLLTGDVKFGVWTTDKADIEKQFLTIKDVFEKIIGQEILVGDTRKLIPDNQTFTVIHRDEKVGITPLFSILFYNKAQFERVVAAAENLDKIAELQRRQPPKHKIVPLKKK